MSRSLNTTLAIKVVMRWLFVVALLSGFCGIFIVSIPAIIFVIVLCVFLITEKKSLIVNDIKSARQSYGAGGYVVTKSGIDSMRTHLVQHPYDHEVALTYARTLSKHSLCDEGKRSYQLAVEGVLNKDMKLATEIFREYLAKYKKPFDHELTFQLALLTEQYGDAHFATHGLEAVINAADVERSMLAKCLKENIRICNDLGFQDIAIMWNKRLESLH